MTPLQVPGYRYFMPFQGGQTFVVVQAEGWLLISTALNFGLARWCVIDEWERDMN